MTEGDLHNKWRKAVDGLKFNDCLALFKEDPSFLYGKVKGKEYSYCAYLKSQSSSFKHQRELRAFFLAVLDWLLSQEKIYLKEFQGVLSEGAITREVLSSHSRLSNLDLLIENDQIDYLYAMSQKGVRAVSFCQIKKFITTPKDHYDAQQKQKFNQFCQTIRFSFLFRLWGGSYFEVLPFFLLASSFLMFYQVFFLLKWFAISYHGLFVARAFMDPLVRGLVFSNVPVLSQPASKKTKKLASCQLVESFAPARESCADNQNEYSACFSINHICPNG